MSTDIQTLSEKELYTQLKSYLDKDEFEETTQQFKILLDKIHGKNAKKFQIVGEKKTKAVTGVRLPSTAPGHQGFLSYEQIPFSLSIYNKKFINPEDANDLAKVGLSFLYGTRIGRRVTGYKYDFSFSAKKKMFYKFIDSEFMKELISIQKVQKNLADIKEKINAIEVSKRKLLSIAALFATLTVGTTMMGIYDQENFAGLKPEVIIGTVPFYSLQMIERAKSDRKLKNRAIGDVFLAHQKGNKDVLRLDLTLSGPYRFIYLAFLAQLQKEGQSIKKNITLSKNALVEDVVAGTSTAEVVDKKVLNYDVHNTFPVITRTAILFNMYLQTIEHHRSVEDGKGVIKVHLLFRKYFPTTAFKVLNPIWDTENNVVIGGSALELGENYGMAKRWLEFTVDAIWKMTKMYGEMYGRMLIGDDGQPRHIIDRQAVSSIDKLMTSYSGKLLGII